MGTVSTHDTSSKEQLKAAVLLYGSFATVHGVKVQKGRPVLQPGSLASKEGLSAALRELLPEKEQGTGLIPDTLLATGIDHMVWWVKPKSRTLWFSCQELGGQRSAIVPNPGLVMITSNQGWFVFAVKGNDRPGPETPLFQAPYFNVWKQGKICTGTAKTPEGEHQDKPSAWEEAFFGSFFTHPNVRAPEKLVSKGGAHKFWKDMLDGKYKKFPESMLVPTGMTLEKMFNAYK